MSLLDKPYNIKGERTGISALIQALADMNIRFCDLHTEQSSLEEIFIDLLQEPNKSNQMAGEK